jgi:broad-specificity NMP kinase
VRDVARRNVLVLGLSGTGKSAVCEELYRRGYNALDADEIFGYAADPVTRVPVEGWSSVNWFWDAERLRAVLTSQADEKVIICGGSANQDEVMHLFGMVFTLVVDDDTLRRRLLDRNDPEELARHMDWNRHVAAHAREHGRIVIDATRPLEAVVDELEEHMRRHG